MPRMKAGMRILAGGGTIGAVLALLVLASIVVALHVRGQPGQPSGPSLSDGLPSATGSTEPLPSWTPDMAAPWTPPEFEPYPWPDPPPTPSWFNDLVEGILNDPYNFSQAIYRLTYKGEVVYYVPTGYPDGWSTLYDTGGNVLGHPSGGFTGLGDGTYRDLWEEVKEGDVVWMNPHGYEPFSGVPFQPNSDWYMSWYYAHHPPPSFPWLNDLIAEFESKPAGDPPRSVHSYFYEGEFVYYVPPERADAWSTLYDVDGNILGHPDSGPAGEGDGTYRDFLDKRVGGTLIWRDSRTYSP